MSESQEDLPLKQMHLDIDEYIEKIKWRIVPDPPFELEKIYTVCMLSDLTNIRAELRYTDPTKPLGQQNPNFDDLNVLVNAIYDGKDTPKLPALVNLYNFLKKKSITPWNSDEIPYYDNMATDPRCADTINELLGYLYTRFVLKRTQIHIVHGIKPRFKANL